MSPLLAALAIVTAACTGSGESTTAPSTSAPSATAAGASSTSAATEGTAAPPATEPTTTTGASTTSTSRAEPDPLREEIDALIEATEEVRGLPFLAPPDLAIVTTAELAQRIRDDIAEDLGDVGPEERLFRLLGMLGEGDDLAVLIEDLLAEQIVGFYDGDTGELVVAGDHGDTLSPLSEITVVHELIHALTDQHFDFNDRLNQLNDEERFDEAAALLALVEGDATYFQLVYLQDAFDLLELAELQEEIESQDFSTLDSAPEFLRADLEFAYEGGFVFVTDLVATDGIAAVDAAYIDPPTTTEHILHPDRFRAGEGGEPVALPATDIPGYQQHEESVFGEWGMSLLFAGVVSPGLVTRLGDGWGGDRYRIIDDGRDVVLILEYVADREQDAAELEEAFADRFEELFAGQPPIEVDDGVVASDEGGYGYVARTTDRIVVVVASDPEVGVSVRDLVGG